MYGIAYILLSPCQPHARCCCDTLARENVSLDGIVFWEGLREWYARILESGPEMQEIIYVQYLYVDRQDAGG